MPTNPQSESTRQLLTVTAPRSSSLHYSERHTTLTLCGYPAIHRLILPARRALCGVCARIAYRDGYELP